MKTSSKKNKRRKMPPELKIARAILLVLVGWCMLAYFGSCKPKEQITVKTEYVERLKFDSIYLQKYDSIYIQKSGDTIRIERFKMVFKDRLKTVKDTINRVDTVFVKSAPTKVEKIIKVPVHGFFWWIGLITSLALVGYLIFKFSNLKLLNFFKK